MQHSSGAPDQQMSSMQGSGSQELAAALRRHFQKVCWARPAATRSESRETYLLGLKRT